MLTDKKFSGNSAEKSKGAMPGLVVKTAVPGGYVALKIVEECSRANYPEYRRSPKVSVGEARDHALGRITRHSERGLLDRVPILFEQFANSV